ncbi:SDR family oxidoreductase [Sinorhizobium alkalisoli]|uniref:NAD(P)-dependent oxidoreductase n=1 Tax=Sinorhizobium alkalisoli TaxID=1752398 RepID=A0A1E3V619_9HYPH|nr:SDR family oxidoreductase [Sinorhizobium alkalisoli]MCG5479502.1 SDR family oxidoreductase [Sinorhizobium alkalisoli]ODR89074.1 NAD(P)-dependent oxidoreductase [Sinorhizobium alkalisoli]
MGGKILVLGSGGRVGSKLVRSLVERGERVKAASRGATPAEGAETIAFDYRDCSTYGHALEGVDRVFVMAPDGYTDPGALLTPMIHAAAARGVKNVLMSVIGADADEDHPYRRVELFLEKTGAQFIILRPNTFADNFHSHWLEGIRHGVIAVPAADSKTGFIDVRDVAECAAAALTTNAFSGLAFDLTGPKALSYHEAAAILSQAIGRPIVYKPVDEETFVGMLATAGVPEDYARYVAGVFRPVREGRMDRVTADVERLTGKKPRSLETYAKDNAAALSA